MSNSPSKVNSGPPIWLWLILVPLTVIVIGGVIITSIPPDLDAVYAEAEELLKDPNKKDSFEKKMAQLEASPEYSDHVNLLRGRVALAQNRELMALKLFGKVSEGSPLEAEAARRSGDAHRRAGDFELAVQSYRSGLDKDKGDGLESRMNLASLYYMAGGIDLAEAELNRNIEIEPNHEPSRMLRARMRVFLEDFEAAREDFEVVLNSPGKYSSAPPDFVGEYFRCLVELDAVEKLEEVALAHLGTVPDPTIKSSVLCKLGEYREAMIVLQGVDSPETESPATKAAQLELLLTEGNHREASVLAAELVTLAPRDLSILQLAAKAFEANGEDRMLNVAEQNIEKLSAIKDQLQSAIKEVSGDITNGPGRAKVARLFGQLGQYREMDSWFQVAVMLDESLADEYVKARAGEGWPTGPIVSFDEQEAEKMEDEPADKPTDKPAEEESAETTEDKPKSDSKEAVAEDESSSKSNDDKPKAAKETEADKPSESSDEKSSTDDPPVDPEQSKDDSKPAASPKKTDS